MGGRPDAVKVRGARVNNLRNVDVDIPLGSLVGIAGVSGSGKSSLALDVLYAEGSRRYLDALSTYTRRRMTQARRPQVDSISYLPPALALHQRPGAGGMRSTFGTMTELLNVLRLMFSRLASHRCPNGHYCPPSLAVATGADTVCPECGAAFMGPGAEDLAFNSTGACPRCQGTGIVRDVDDATLVPDESLSIDEGAVVPWRTFGFNVQPDIVREFGVRTNVPFRSLTDAEREIVFNGPEEKKHIVVTSMKGVHDLDFTFRNARLTVLKELERAVDEKRFAKVAKFLVERTCPDCGGTRLSDAARAPRIGGVGLAEVTAWPLRDVLEWAGRVPDGLPAEMRDMAATLVATLREMGGRLMQLGLGYLTLDRSSASLSTGERQRAQLSRAVRNETTGVLYVLDEPSTGLHPANIEGLIGVMHDLLDAGNSVVFVDHDVRVLRAADHFIEMGPGAGREGGRILAQGTPDQIAANPDSRIAGFLTGREPSVVRERAAIPPLPADWAEVTAGSAVSPDGEGEYAPSAVSDVDAESSAFGCESGANHPWLRMATAPIHTVHALDVAIPRGRLTAVTGVSGSGKTTMILESLVPAIEACTEDRPLPAHVTSIDPAGIDRVRIVDSTPIGINVRSTLATYSGVMDMLRRAFAGTGAARAHGYKLADFSYNTGSLRCPQCDGTGRVDLDIQFLPDVTIPCPSCEGRRYRPEADAVRLATPGRPRGLTMPEVLALSVDEALAVFDPKGSVKCEMRDAGPVASNGLVAGGDAAMRTSDAIRAGVDDRIAPTLCRRIHSALETLSSLGLGYLTLGEDTPSLSGGEAQRLKLSNELGKKQHTSMFVLDEPTTGLHPLDVRTLIGVLQRLLDGGATIVVIEHDLDMIANADFVIDMGPGGGEDGGRIVAVGTPEDIADNPDSLTGRYLRSVL
ncbi:excinuclease ABC subunit UvrA [Bifidobacterium pullorum]|uniref:excinuclease ABC subunit UvrA n=1 Tax=Bifidobacterium pullorum TaxID=78448 RepID=UPI003F1ED9B2